MDLIVFVQLGKNPAPTLNLFAKQAQDCYLSASVILLTDNRKRHKGFPGSVIEIETKDLFSNLKSEDKKLHKRMGGYWLHTLNRLFVLRYLKDHFPENSRIIHLESDVLSLISDPIGNAIWAKFEGVGVPRFSKDSGIASILIASELERLVKALDSLAIIAKETSVELDDMHLLGIGLDQEILKDLNLESIKYVDPELQREVELYFDGLAAGQYLYGCNMVHSKGFIKSGYEQSNSPILFARAKWNIPRWHHESELTLDFSYNEIDYRVANLHIHSKLKIKNCLSNKKFWENSIEKANNGQVVVYRTPSILYKTGKSAVRYLVKVKSKFNVWF
jgi:hypothetical protein